MKLIRWFLDIFYNPFKPHIVHVDHQYAIRKWDCRWEYYGNDGTWWGEKWMMKYSVADLETIKKRLESLQEIEEKQENIEIDRLKF